MDEAAVRSWLERYVEAWRSYDPDDIGNLFSVDAVYRYHPWDDGDDAVRGRDAIVTSWLEDTDERDSWSASYEPWLVAGDRAVALGVSRYRPGDREAVPREYHNVFLLRFDGEQRCTEFTELYARRKD
ncbi:MAG TPA: nuclear transport factor 2 family protein [Gaiellaceae bacterium]|nr:nuclear transport factor 2 family protein [Gaiellaceae bacterium]